MYIYTNTHSKCYYILLVIPYSEIKNIYFLKTKFFQKHKKVFHTSTFIYQIIKIILKVTIKSLYVYYEVFWFICQKRSEVIHTRLAINFAYTEFIIDLINSVINFIIPVKYM